MKRLKERLIPVILITTGIYLIIIPYVFRYEFSFSNSLMLSFSQILIVLGIVIYGFQELKNRLIQIEKELEISKENKVSKAKLITNDIANDFINEIKRRRYIYKASIYLPSANMENLFLIQNLLSNTKIDSKMRLIVNLDEDDLIDSNNLNSLNNRFIDKIDLKIINSKDYKHYLIIIIDTEIWIINDFGTDIKSHLLFNISSYNKQGKSFIELFIKLWDKSSKYLNKKEI